MSESVLCVRREYISNYIDGRTGVITGVGETLAAIISAKHEFVPRDKAEGDPSFKQIIPYVAVCRGESVFATRRLSKGGEARLHGLISIGVGGHINPTDERSGGDPLSEGLRREVSEEVRIDRELSLTPLGVINDDTNEVGRVHLGFLFRMEVEGDVSVRETEKLEGFWLTLRELEERYDKLETWSQITVDCLKNQ